MENNKIFTDEQGIKYQLQEDGTLKELNKGRFIPKLNQVYYHINDVGTTRDCRNEDDNYDKWIIRNNPVFETKQECEEYLKYLNLLNEYKHEFTNEEWGNDNIAKYYITYNYQTKNIHIGYAINVRCECSKFVSRERALEFIEKVGENNIKKFMFGIWE